MFLSLSLSLSLCIVNIQHQNKTQACSVGTLKEALRQRGHGQDVCYVETYDETYRGEDAISDKTFDGTECTLVNAEKFERRQVTKIMLQEMQERWS